MGLCLRMKRAEASQLLTPPGWELCFRTGVSPQPLKERLRDRMLWQDVVTDFYLLFLHWTVSGLQSMFPLDSWTSSGNFATEFGPRHTAPGLFTNGVPQWGYSGYSTIICRWLSSAMIRCGPNVYRFSKVLVLCVGTYLHNLHMFTNIRKWPKPRYIPYIYIHGVSGWRSGV